MRQIITCSRCGAEVPGRPVEREGKLYCCDGCAQGSPCLCRQLQAERLLSLEGGGRCGFGRRCGEG